MALIDISTNTRAIRRTFLVRCIRGLDVLIIRHRAFHALFPGAHDFPAAHFEAVGGFVVDEVFFEDAADFVDAGADYEDCGLGGGGGLADAFEADFYGLGVFSVEAPQDVVDVWH